STARTAAALGFNVVVVENATSSRTADATTSPSKTFFLGSAACDWPRSCSQNDRQAVTRG
ncbi:MAG TPA: hypothetical protein VHU84_14610, partial [Lacipirellulaceae bacterium]|nr:hypothetical protein [Lacipirellulaceae bacterium]